MVRSIKFYILVFGLVLQLILPPLSNAQNSSATQRVLDKAIREIQSSDTAERRKGAYALNNLGINALPALEHIIRGIEDDDEQIWFQSIDLVAKLGPKAEKAIPTLVNQLKSDRGRYKNQIAYRTAFALGKIGKAAIPSLGSLIIDSSATRRRTAALAFGWIEPKATDAIPDLLELLEDQNEEVRYATIETFGRIGEPAIAPIVSVLKTSKSSTKIISSLRALEKIGPSASKAQNAVSKFLEPDSDPKVSMAAVKALGAFRLKGEILVSYLNSRIESEDSAVWEACLQSFLLCQNRKSLTPWLEKNLSSKSDLVRNRTLSLVEKMGPDASGTIPQLIDLANQGNDSGTSKSAINALELLGAESFLPLIIEVAPYDIEDLSDSMWQIRTLNDIGHLAINDLTSALNSDFGSVKWSALNTIENRKIQSNQILSTITRLSSDPEPSIRKKALSTLIGVKLPSRQLIPIVQKLIADPDVSVQNLAIASIPSLGDGATLLEETILSGLASQDVATRILYLNSISALPNIPKQIVAQLTDNIQNDSAEEQIAKVAAFGKLGLKAKTSIGSILSISNNQNSKLEKITILSLAKIGPKDPRVVSHIEKYLSSDNAEFKFAAFEVLNDISLDPNKKIEYVGKGLRDDNQQVREISANYILKLGTAGRIFAARLFEMLNQENDDHTFVIETLKAIRSPNIDLYVGALKNKESSVRLFATETLGKMGKRAESALPALRQVSENDTYSPVRRAASSAIRNIIRKR